MKKVFYLLVGLLLLPSIVKADMAPPTVVLGYKAIVSNPDGITVYKWNDKKQVYEETGKKSPYGTQFTVFDSEEFICIDDSKGECTDLYVDPKDLEVIDKDFKVDTKKLEGKTKAITLKQVEVRKGPAPAYEVVGTIEAGTNITIQELTRKEIEDGSEVVYLSWPWVYVEYEDLKGFISVYNRSVAYDLEEIDILSTDKIYISDVNTGKVIKTIPSETKCKVVLGEIDLYDEEYNGKIDQRTYYYMSYDGVQGIVRYDTSGFFRKVKKVQVELKKEEKVYQSYYFENEQDAKVITTLPVGTVVTSEYYIDDYKQVIYYEKGKTKGYIILSEEKEEEQEKPKKEEPKKEVIKPVAKPKKDYTLYICIGVGVILSLTALVIILLINKKKKNKETLV